MRKTIALVFAAVLLAPAGAAQAHKGNPNYESIVNAVSAAGLKVTVINRDDRLLFENTTGKDVIIEGYEEEPYVRIKADGTVEVNRNSKAYYLNRERFQTESAPEGLDTSKEDWEVVSKTGRYEFHDHRMHWMGKGKPEAVKDEGERTKVFDWTVPVRVDGAPAKVAGTLFWVPTASSGAPIGAIVAGAVIVIALSVGVFVVRRRRAAGEAGGAGAGGSTEAW